MGIVRLKAGHSNSTLRLLAVRGIHSFSRSNRLQHRRVSVTLLIALWNPNSPSAELLWIHPRSTAKKPSTRGQETCEHLKKEPGLNAIGSRNGWLFRWDKPNQRKREQMVFSSLSIVRFYWLGCPCQDISTSFLIVGPLSSGATTATMTFCSAWWVGIFSGFRESQDQEHSKQLGRLNETHLCLPSVLLCSLTCI